jgi:hypothetical protein
MKHGSAHAYVELKCRCDECRIASNQRASKNRRRIAYGLPSQFVDAAPAKAHLQWLLSKGWGVPKIAELTGLHRTTIRQLAYGRSPAEQTHSRQGRPAQISKILRRNSEIILGLKFSLDESSPCTSIDAQGFIRRAEALACMGYSFAWQADQIGLTKTNFHKMLTQQKVFAKSLRKLDALFRQYAFTKRVPNNWHDQAAITRTLARAQKHGWVSAMGWDDIDTDVQPVESVKDKTLIDLVKIDLFIHGEKLKLSSEEKEEAFVRLVRAGMTTNQAGVRLSMNTAKVKRLAEELS